jgi:ubiquinone/menaquinone biosynthesis C-methylase UbiE
MINAHLRRYAVKLDEAKYQVVLRDRLDYSANEVFADDSYWSAPWFARYWHKLFQSKANAAGVAVRPDDKVLDCCCGHGYLGEVFEEKFRARVTFCDLSATQLAELRARRARSGAAQANVLEADLLHLPFPDASFDWAVGNSFLHHLPDVPAALRELNRVTKPGGGAVLFHEPTTTSIFWESFPLSIFKDTRPTAESGNFTDLWLFTPDSLRPVFEEAGFADVRILGTGILSALLINWYLIVTSKLRSQSRAWVYPAYLLRAWLNKLDLLFQPRWKKRLAPSIMVVARKVERIG